MSEILDRGPRGKMRLHSRRRCSSARSSAPKSGCPRSRSTTTQVAEQYIEPLAIGGRSFCRVGALGMSRYLGLAGVSLMLPSHLARVEIEAKDHPAMNPFRRLTNQFPMLWNSWNRQTDHIGLSNHFPTPNKANRSDYLRPSSTPQCTSVGMMSGEGVRPAWVSQPRYSAPL